MIDAAVLERPEREKLVTLDAMVAFHAARRPDKVALYFEDESLTWAEWQRRGWQVANGLMAAGCPRQSRIAYLGKNNIRTFEVLAGCAKAGMVFTALSWRLALPEILTLIDNFDSEAVFVGSDFCHYIKAIRESRPALRLILEIEGDGVEAIAYDLWRDQQSDAEPAVTPSPEEIVLQLHTSGTTGTPKGAMLSNRAIMSTVRHAETGEMGVWDQQDLVLVPLPLFHIGGLGWALHALYIGGTDVILREAHPGGILKALTTMPVTKAGFVPAVIQAVINDPSFDRSKVGSLQMIGFGGAPITQDLLERGMKALDCDFLQMFGMTECGAMAAAVLMPRGQRPADHILKSCGIPYQDCKIRIIDAEGHELPLGETGEIEISTPCLMAGYYKREAETAEVLRNGWYRTGDAGALDAGGYLYIRDRIKDMIISGGENIYPAEVEQALATFPGMIEAGVVGVPSEKWGEDVKAFVVLGQGAKATEAEIIQHCKSRIASFKCPKSVEFLDVLPRNPSGKILKRVLREPYWQQAGRAI